MSHAKAQHYVPRFLLTGFETSPGSAQVHVYDKRRSKAFLAGVGGVAKEKAFYDIQLDEMTLTFEPGLSELESEAAEVLNQVLAKVEIGFLTSKQREVIARFVLAQNMRTRQFLESVHAGTEMMAEALEQMQPGSAAAMGLTPNREESRLVALSLLRKSVEWVPLILDKTWGLYEAPPDYPYWISDHPVVMHNNVNPSDVRGTIGLAVPGIEIYLPISARYCLGFICPTLREMTDEAYERSLRLKAEHDVELPTHDVVGSLWDGFEYGFPIRSVPSNVDYVNSLEVLYAERFVFSGHGDFSMVEQMIAENPRVRSGPRPSVN